MACDGNNIFSITLKNFPIEPFPRVESAGIADVIRKKQDCNMIIRNLNSLTDSQDMCVTSKST